MQKLIKGFPFFQQKLISFIRTDFLFSQSLVFGLFKVRHDTDALTAYGHVVGGSKKKKVTVTAVGKIGNGMACIIHISL